MEQSTNFKGSVSSVISNRNEIIYKIVDRSKQPDTLGRVRHFFLTKHVTALCIRWRSPFLEVQLLPVSRCDVHPTTDEEKDVFTVSYDIAYHNEKLPEIMNVTPREVNYNPSFVEDFQYVFDTFTDSSVWSGYKMIPRRVQTARIMSSSHPSLDRTMSRQRVWQKG